HPRHGDRAEDDRRRRHPPRPVRYEGRPRRPGRLSPTPSHPPAARKLAAGGRKDEPMLAYEYQSDGSMRLVDKPTPTAGPGEVTVDVEMVGVCGTDLKIARGEHRLYPAGTVRVPGHEVVGRIRENRS